MKGHNTFDREVEENMTNGKATATLPMRYRGAVKCAVLIFFAAEVTLAPAYVQAQSGALVDSLVAACGARGCPPPSDALRREGYAVRLAGIVPLDGAMAKLGPAIHAECVSATDSKVYINNVDEARRARFATSWIRIAAGNRHASEGRFDVAQAHYESALKMSDVPYEPQAGAAVHNNLGAVAAATGHYDQAFLEFELALTAYNSLEQRGVQPPKGWPESVPCKTAPWVSQTPPQFAEAAAVQGMSASIESMTRVKTSGAVLVLLNIGNVAALLERYDKAESSFNAALALAQKDHGHTGERLALAELVALNRALGRHDVENGYQRQYLHTSVDDTLPRLVEQGALILTAQMHPPLPVSEVLPTEIVATSIADATYLHLIAEAKDLESRHDLTAARERLVTALLWSQSLQRPEYELATLTRLQQQLAATGAFDEAVFYGKRAVNVAQGLKRNLGQLDRRARQAYLSIRRQPYVLLAQALLDSQRLPEAEHVLLLLKEDEGQQLIQRLVRPDLSPTTKPEPPSIEQKRIPYTTEEAKTWELIDSIVSRLHRIDLERGTIQPSRQTDGASADLASIEHGRIRELDDVERNLKGFEPPVYGGILASMQVTVLALLAKSNRDMPEAKFLTDYARRIHTFQRDVGINLDTLQTLIRDVPNFTNPPTVAEITRLTELQARTARLASHLAELAYPVREVPNAEPTAASPFLARILGIIDGSLQKLWVMERATIELQKEQLRLDISLRGVLKSAAKRGENFVAPESAHRLLNLLPSGTVAVHYLPGDKRLDVLIVSRTHFRSVHIDLSRDLLVDLVERFRGTLQNPSFGDTKLLGRRLYGLLFEPITDYLHAEGATTLMLSLDGPLRDLPFAALYDGQKWLVQRYAMALYTTITPAALIARPAVKWRVAGMGATAGHGKLPPLPGVVRELESIVRHSPSEDHGLMFGTLRLDSAFTAAGLSQALQERPQVVHIASHFLFNSEDVESSGLLLGDGNMLSLSALSGPSYRFDQVELVTLSACQTALVASNKFGQDVESLGALLQSQGAGSVVASLWRVNDESTARFMRTMYAARERGFTRAQALQQAQLYLLESSDNVSDNPPGNRTHPYFWAPFVLMGNWL